MGKSGLRPRLSGLGILARAHLDSAVEPTHQTAALPTLRQGDRRRSDRADSQSWHRRQACCYRRVRGVVCSNRGGPNDRDRRVPGQQRGLREHLQGPATAAAQQACRRRRVHGRPARRVPDPRPGRGRGPRHPQRRRSRHRRRDPLARNQPATARHQRDHPDSPHRLRHADLHRRRVQAGDPGRNRYQAGVGGRGVPRCRGGRAAVATPRRAKPLCHQTRIAARVRLRRRHRQAQRGHALSLVRVRFRG